jgi:hypothetical protein
MADEVRPLREPRYTKEEKESALTHLFALRKVQIEEFLRTNELRTSGPKAELRSRLEAALESRELSYADLVRYLDSSSPWGKQHVLLYRGPSAGCDAWRKEAQVRRRLARRGLERYLNASLALILPDAIRLSSIVHTSELLRVVAVERRDWYERKAEYDRRESMRDGTDLVLKGFIHHVVRGLFTFEWNLVANSGSLQITQLPTGHSYEDASERFWTLVAPWLGGQWFSPVDLAPAVAQLHRGEEGTDGETRSHGFDYRTITGRRLWGRSATARQPLLGEAVIDQVLGQIRDRGVAGVGNFYWLPGLGSKGQENPLRDEVHVIIVANRGRIDFPTPNSERVVRYVLSRIRALCG